MQHARAHFSRCYEL